MEALVPQASRCRTCNTILQEAGDLCTTCQPSLHVQPQMTIQQFVPMKSKGIAILLTFFWLGAGHLYADKIGTGIVLMLVDMVLVLISLTGIGFIIALPVWIILFVLAALLSTAAVDQFNTTISTSAQR